MARRFNGKGSFDRASPCGWEQQNNYLSNWQAVKAIEPYPVVQHSQRQGRIGLKLDLKFQVQDALLGLQQGDSIGSNRFNAQFSF